MRGAITAVLGAIIRIFFRRLEVSGREHVPATGPVIFVANHPNALFDPLVLLCKVGRPVSFLAKEPLFRTPVIGWFVRALDSIPVYRQMDQADTRRNLATFSAARDLLARGGSIAVFPEGTSHSDPRLKPFRTGVARIALGAATGVILVIPAGLFYTEKTRFRSSALLCFGPPIRVPGTAPDQDGDLPTGPVRDLTARLEEALGALTLQADQLEALRLVESAERIISSASVDGSAGLSERFQIRQRLLAGHARLRTEAPERLDAILSRIARHAAALDDAHVTPELLPATGYHAWAVLRVTIRSLIRLVILLPLAVAGMVLHAPAWTATDLIARRITRGSPDMVATVKALGGVLFYVVTWIVVGAAAGARWGVWFGLVALAAGPVAGFAALRFRERLDRLVGGARGLALALSGQGRFRRLLAERRAIRDDLVRLGEEFGV
jgi:1-acyl-sn-glycerol-3-phosphate acyltransferase